MQMILLVSMKVVIKDTINDATIKEGWLFGNDTLLSQKHARFRGMLKSFTLLEPPYIQSKYTRYRLLIVHPSESSHMIQLYFCR